MRKGCKLKDICICRASNISLKDIKTTTGDFPLYGASGFVQTIDSYHMGTPYIGIVKDGSGVGRVNMYPAYSSLLGTMQYIIPKDNCIVNYLYFLLCNLNLSDFARGAAIPHIYFTDYGNIGIKLHSLEQQYQIVEELNCLTSIIEKQKKQLEELDNLAQSIFYDMFGDPIENERGWDSTCFGDLFLLRSGNSLPAKKQIPGDFKVYGGNGINGTHVEFNREGEYIIIGRVGAYCGNVRIAKGAFWLTDNAFELIQVKEIQNTIYLLYLLRVINLFRYANKAAQPVISNVVLRDITIPLPPLSLQQKFASKIEAIEKQKELIKKSIKETEDLFNSRMDYYFN